GTIREHVEVQRRLGVRSEVLSLEDIARRWPALERLEGVGASFCADDGYLDQHRGLWGLVRAAIGAGVAIQCGVEVEGPVNVAGRIEALRTTIGEVSAGTYVNCAGAWAPALGGEDDRPLPIAARRVQLLKARTGTPLPPDLPWLIDSVRQVHLRPDVP